MSRHTRGSGLPRSVALSFARQVARALSYLKRRDVYHRDVKPENLLLTAPLAVGPPDCKNGGRGNGNERALSPDAIVQLSDFGWAIHAPPPNHHRRTTLCGTPEYVPPEMIRRKRAVPPSLPPLSPPGDHGEGESDCDDNDDDDARSSVSSSYSSSSSLSPPPEPREGYDVRRVDAWALGVLTYEMVRGRTPFYLPQSEQRERARAKGYDAPHEAVFDLVREFRPKILLGLTSSTSSSESLRRGGGDNSEEEEEGDGNEGNFLHLVRGLLDIVPDDRIEVDDVLSHPWINSGLCRGGGLAAVTVTAAVKSKKRTISIEDYLDDSDAWRARVHA